MRSVVLAPIVVSLSLGLLCGCARSQSMRLRVDATDIPRHLVRAEATVPVEMLSRDSEGDADFWYVEWVPGNHNPSGPIQNLVDFRVTDDRGRTLEWTRDFARTVRKTVRVPDGAREVRLSYTYIASQPWVNSRSTDTYGLPNMGGLNFNNVLFYPDGADKNTMLIDAELLLPDGWSATTALFPPGENHIATLDGRLERIGLPTASLARYVDSPVIFGRHLRSWEMDSPSDALHTFDAVAPAEEFLDLPEARLAKFNHMLAECEAVFGPFPWDQFRFLILLSDDLPGFGLEHRDSTYIRYPERTLLTCEVGAGNPMTTVPHEYIHVWCGKLRAQKGLLHEDYHTPGDTRLMWVYEGLTSYYDDVIAARTGLYSFERFRDTILGNMERYMLQPGRRWKSVEDTGAGLRHLRERSERFENLRRRQDYYSEGSLFWMEADAIIRGATDGRRSLDDFTRAFFDVPKPETEGGVVEFTRDEVVRTLESVYSGVDWDALIRERIESPQESLGFDSLVERLGHRFEHREEPFTASDKAGARARSADLRSSLGVRLSETGEVLEVLVDSPAWRAGLGYEMQVVGIKTPGAEDSTDAFSGDAIREATRVTPRTGGVDLLVEWGGVIRPVRIAYDGGLRYPALAPIEGRTDLLKAIAAPRTEAPGGAED